MRKRPDGRWEGRYTAGRDPATGKAIYKNVLAKTQKECKEKLARAIEKNGKIDVTKSGQYTVEEWCWLWHENYVQENCALGISDNIIVYGHHMNNGSMFADLCKYEREGFYREHPIVRFDTLSSLNEYEIVAVFKTVAYSEKGFKYYHFVDAAGEDDFNAFVSQCKALALYDTGVSAEYGDKLLTLSTCEYSRTNGRMVVVAKLIDPEAGGNA